MIFDPLYFILLAPGLLLAMYAQWKVQSAFHEGNQIPSAAGVTGAQTAHLLMQQGGVHNVIVEPVAGELTDHYSPQEKVLRLSEPVYDSTSLAAIGVAAHECGHAFQDAERDVMLVARNAIVPLANFGGSISWLMIMGGAVLASMGMALGRPVIFLGIAAFSLTVLFQLINLPVEFDASRRARRLLQQTGLISPDEDQVVRKVLNAAALTYVAGTLTSALTLVYFLIRFGLGSNDRENSTV